MRIGEKTIEIFRCGRRIALHLRSFAVGRHTTLPEHRPPQHQDLEWTSDRVIAKGKALFQRAAGGRLPKGSDFEYLFLSQSSIDPGA